MANLKDAKIMLEDGTVFKGYTFAASGEDFGEVVFNTSMTGYQEIISDPSYCGQIVVMTSPLIGNYGVNIEDDESAHPFFNGLIIKECSAITSNWRATKDLGSYLKEHRKIGIQGVDTRALTRHIRLNGAMRAVVSTDDLDDVNLLEKVKRSLEISGRNLVEMVSTKEKYQWTKKGKYHVVVIDCGVKFSILRMLNEHDCRVTVVPYDMSSEDILALDPQGILVSNGPGDPSAVVGVKKVVQQLLGKLPIFGICLGHQILGLSLGGVISKLKFGHHGGNHPVKDLQSARVMITAQNHGFSIEESTLNKQNIEVTHLNLNDQTVEGIRHKEIPAFSVQFHPEAGPGPHDAGYLFQKFTKMMGTHCA